MQYQIDSGSFNDITNLNYSSSANSGASIGTIDLSGIVALQNVGAGTNITFRIVNFGGTSSGGTWYVYDAANSTALDLAVQGTVAPILVVTTNPPAIAPSLSEIAFTNNYFQFMLTGTASSNYIVQATTNLMGSNWISLQTNAAPFLFIESNMDLFMERFYRGLLAP